MYRNLAVVFFVLGCLEFSNATHSTSLSFVETPEKLENSFSVKNVLESFEQVDAAFYTRTDKFLEQVLPKVQQIGNNLMIDALKNGNVVMKYFQNLASAPQEGQSNIAEAISQIIIDFENNSANASQAQVNQVELNDILKSVKQIDAETLKTIDEYLAAEIDSLKNTPSNMIFKTLVKADLFLAFCERNEPIPTPENEKLNAAVEKILPHLAIEFEMAAKLAAAITGGGSGK